MSKAAVVALYARVSSEQQAKSGTIDSQTAALTERIVADGGKIVDDMRFIDAGISGATLIRPQLERLRDCAALGLVDRLYVLAPDRLSRKYAHQALLMEELAACGVQVIFLNHAIGASPEEALLLQMQGMISEYERAKIMERNRRGKLHGAKRGSVNVLSNAPYGYRYIRKQFDGTPAQYVIELPQAATIRSIFQWIGVDRLSIGDVVRRLAAEGIASATGKPVWDRSTVWGILHNPAYMGRAAFGKTQACDCLPRIRAQRHSADVLKNGYSTVSTDPSSWIEIAVPAIISEALFHSVQEQLTENRKTARQHAHGATYLLQGLVVCGLCRYAYYGKKISASSAKGHVRNYAYYRCIGTDAYRFGGQRICTNLQVRTDRLDDLVWLQVVELLAHPERLKHEYERRLSALEKKERTSFDTAALEKQRLQLEKGKSRLIDSYTEGVIEKTDFEPKVRQLKTRLEQIDHQIQELRRHNAGQRELFLVINRLEEFAAAVSDRLGTMDFITKREIIRAVVKRVEIHPEEILVVFRVDPDPGFNTGKIPTNSDEGNTSMQDRPGRQRPTLRCTFLPLTLHPVHQHPRFEETPNQLQHPLIRYLPGQSRHQDVVIDPIKELRQIQIDYPAAAFGNVLLRLSHRLPGITTRSKSEARLGESRFEPRLQDLQQCLLD
jgi:site-specific DNA recombinase